MLVPQPVKRTVGDHSPNFLWDNTAYVLGVTAGRRQADWPTSMPAFVERHLDALTRTDDPGLQALLVVSSKSGRRTISSRRCGPTT